VGSSGGVNDESPNTAKGSGGGEGVQAWEDEKTDWERGSSPSELRASMKLRVQQSSPKCASAGLSHGGFHPLIVSLQRAAEPIRWHKFMLQSNLITGTLR
jgi:hypothetical protein